MFREGRNLQKKISLERADVIMEEKGGWRMEPCKRKGRWRSVFSTTPTSETARGLEPRGALRGLIRGAVFRDLQKGT